MKKSSSSSSSSFYEAVELRMKFFKILFVCSFFVFKKI